MKTRKLLSLLLFLVLGILLVGCVKDEPTPGDKDKIYTDDEIPTPLTDEFKFTKDYEGKDFIEDGIGQVTFVSHVDGDTTIFRTLKGQVITVRYLGIDTPESTYKVEPWGFAAAKFVKKVMENARDNDIPIVLQADEVNSQRVDSTGKRYLAWVWVGGRLINLELVEQCYTATKAAGTMYASKMIEASVAAEAFGTRIWNRTLKDPEYDYSVVGQSMSLQEINEQYNTVYSVANELDKGKRVRIQGIVTRKLGGGNAYIQQQVDGHWHIGLTNTEVVATDGSSFPYIGENGNWFVEETDLGIQAQIGEIGQNAYEVYVDSLPDGETPLNQYVWARRITVAEPDENNLIPYIVRENKWYGLYLYGGYQDVTNFQVGREIYTTGTIGYFGGAVQVTSINDATVQIYSLNNEIEPLEITADDFNPNNRHMLGLLVKMENLLIVDGYNTKKNNPSNLGFTIEAKVNGKDINIRIPNETYIYDDKGNRVSDWEYFDGITLDVVGIMSIFDGELQILVANQNDLTY
jgi:endonuclease YncB( thermonuclease family)